MRDPLGSLCVLGCVVWRADVMSRLLSLQSRDESSGSSVAESLSSSLSSLSLSGPSSWKVLIYDRYCQDILSPLLTVAELRRLGITLHMALSAPRERVPDVPAIYLCRPTADNIAAIARDVRRGIYDSTHLNFSTPIPRAMLEQLAQAILLEPEAALAPAGRPAQAANPLNSGAAAASRIVRVLDQYCEFISLEEQLFTLNSTDSFLKLHGASTPAEEAAMFAHVEEMVESLFCVVVSMGVVPIIRATAGHAAEMVAQKLEQRLRDHLASRNNLFANNATSSLSFHRPTKRCCTICWACRAIASQCPSQMPRPLLLLPLLPLLLVRLVPPNQPQSLAHTTC